MIEMIIITLIIIIEGIEDLTATTIITNLDSLIKAVIIIKITDTEMKDRNIIIVITTDSHQKISITIIKKIIIEIDKNQITNQK
jgi:hypothetical protein